MRLVLWGWMRWCTYSLATPRALASTRLAPQRYESDSVGRDDGDGHVGRAAPGPLSRPRRAKLGR